MKLPTSKKFNVIATAVAAVLVLAACAGGPSSSQAPTTAASLDAEFKQMLKTSFSELGIAKMDRIEQDLGQSACSDKTPPPEAVVKRVEAEALSTIRWPTGGQYFGDWRKADALAQSGRGMTWTDKSTDTKANGGQCYNCHQIDKKEISFGTIGPSLWNYGKIRGVKNVTDPSAAPIVQYTWGKLWNSKAYSGCSNMPRFGHAKLLDETQIRDLMSLLLDPGSPVNQ